jgi:hypothetical protein
MTLAKNFVARLLNVRGKRDGHYVVEQPHPFSCELSDSQDVSLPLMATASLS